MQRIKSQINKNINHQKDSPFCVYFYFLGVEKKIQGIEMFSWWW